jgi:hypothetical protein
VFDEVDESIGGGSAVAGAAVEPSAREKLPPANAMRARRAAQMKKCGHGQRRVSTSHVQVLVHLKPASREFYSRTKSSSARRTGA